MPAEKVQSKKREFIWVAVLWYIHLHVLGFYGFYLLITQAKWLTVLFGKNEIFLMLKKMYLIIIDIE